MGKPIRVDNLPRSREEAIERRERYFFTGEPCKNGHVDRRYVISGACIGCQKEAEHRYKDKARRALGIGG